MFRKSDLVPVLGAIAFAIGAASPAVALAQDAASGETKPVARADVPVTARMGMHVSALVLEDLRQFVTDEQKLGPMFLRLVLLAKQEAIGTNCTAFDLDKQQLLTLMKRTVQPLSEGVEKDVATSQLHRALRQYNTLLGGELAVFAYDPDGYCDAAAVLFKELGEDGGADSMLAIKPAG